MLILSAFFLLAAGPGTAPAPAHPNIVFILADDLGYGDVGCYGQKRIHTPNLDRMARQGCRFTNHYGGSNVCAPSRCVLLSGKHPGHAYLRENRQATNYPEGQMPVPPGTLRLPILLHQLGYATGGFGKWALGPIGTAGDPLNQGFDRWYGFNCQAEAHNYYPTHLWDGDKRVAIDNPAFSAHQKLSFWSRSSNPANYVGFLGQHYAPDLIGEQALRFVRENKDRPFFLYYPTTVPHLALQVPEDSLKEYAGKFPETPYTGNHSYLPHLQPRAAYAAMITRMDREVGKLLALLKELQIEENTLVVFTSDNGPLYDHYGGTDAEFFDSTGGLRGRKGSFYEGGFREPCIACWPGHIPPGRTEARVTGFEDWLPTLLEVAGATDVISRDADGISFAPTLLGRPQAPRPFLYRESPGYGGQQAVRTGDWKAIRRDLNPFPKPPDCKPGPVELYDLATDPAETHDVAAQHPDIVARIKSVMAEQHVKSEVFGIRALDSTK